MNLIGRHYSDLPIGYIMPIHRRYYFTVVIQEWQLGTPRPSESCPDHTVLGQLAALRVGQNPKVYWLLHMLT